MAPSAVDIESELLKKLDVDGSFDSGEFATSLGVDHNVVVGVIKSLESYEMIATEVSRSFCRLSLSLCSLSLFSLFVLSLCSLSLFSLCSLLLLLLESHWY